MKGVYRSIADRRHLIPKERDLVTGRLGRTRDQKGRHAGTVPALSGRPRSVIVVAIAVLVLVLVGGIAAAVNARRDPQETADRTPPGNRTDAANTTTSAQQTTTMTDPPATAISLSYTGGSFTRQGCTDLLNSGGCPRGPDTGFDPLPVRCTPQQCQVTIFGQAVPLTETATAASSFPYEGPQCGIAPWTLQLRAVGSKVTRGIKHPARLVGQASFVGQAQVLPSANCIGADVAYQYDAVPE